MRVVVLAVLAACGGGGSSPATDGGEPDRDGNNTSEASTCPPDVVPDAIDLRLGFTSDATHFYFTPTNTELARRPVSGGADEKLADLPGTIEGPVVVGDQHVFGVAGGIAFRVPKTGGTPESLGSVEGQVTELVTDGSALYFGAVQSSFELRRAATVGGPTTLLTDVSANGLDAAATDGVHLYWTSQQGGVIRRIPVTGGAVEEFADSKIEVAANISNFGLVVTDDEVMWSAAYQSFLDGRVFAQPKAGGARRELTHTNLPSGLGVVGDNLYVVLTSSISKIARIPLGGGPREIIGCVDDRAFSVTARDHGVYVTEAGTVLRFDP